MKFLNIVGGNFFYNPYEFISLKGVVIMLTAMSFLLILSKILRKKPIQFPQFESSELDNYILAIQKTTGNQVKVSRTTRVVLFALSALIVYTPLSELLRLDVSKYFYY